MKNLKLTLSALLVITMVACNANDPNDSPIEVEETDKSLVTICDMLDSLKKEKERAMQEIVEFAGEYEKTNPEFGEKAKGIKEDFGKIDSIIKKRHLELQDSAQGFPGKVEEENARYEKEKAKYDAEFNQTYWDAFYKGIDKDKEAKKFYAELEEAYNNICKKIANLGKPPFMCGTSAVFGR